MRSLFVALLLFLGSVTVYAQSPQLNGKILNGTTQEEGRAETVTLILLQGGMQEIATLKDIQGAFEFPLEHLDKSQQSGPFLLKVTYDGVDYFKAIGPFQLRSQPLHEITVYEQVDNLDNAEIKLPHLFIKRTGDTLLFNWNYEVDNPTMKTMHHEGGLLRIGVPDNVESLNVLASRGTMPVRVSLARSEKDGSFLIKYPIRPGKTGFEVSYSVDYSAGAYTLSPKLFYNVGKVMGIFHPEDLQVESDGLQIMQVDTQNHVKIAAWESIDPETPWQISVSGGSQIAESKAHAHNDHEVVERPPPTASLGWIILSVLGVGLGINVFLFLRQRSVGVPRFDFSGVPGCRRELAQLLTQRKSGKLDEKSFKKKRDSLLKEAWKVYLKENDGD